MKLYNLFLNALCAGAMLAATAGVAGAYKTGVDSTGFAVGDSAAYDATTSKWKNSNRWYPDLYAYKYSGMPVGTVVPLSTAWTSEDARNKGYLRCDATTTFSASEFPELARRLQVCSKCGNPLRTTATSTTVNDSKGTHFLYGYSAGQSLNFDGSKPYCVVCKGDVDWKFCYNVTTSKATMQDSSKIGVPNLTGQFLRGFNNGTGYNTDAGAKTGSVWNPQAGQFEERSYDAMPDSSKRSAHLSGQLDQQQTAVANGSDPTGQFKIPTSLPDGEEKDGNYSLGGSGTGNRWAVEANNGVDISLEYGMNTKIISEDMTKVGKIFNYFSNPLNLIPGVWQKTKTYTIGTPTHYELNANIGTISDTAQTYGDLAHPVNQAVIYYIKAR